MRQGGCFPLLERSGSGSGSGSGSRSSSSRQHLERWILLVTALLVAVLSPAAVHGQQQPSLPSPWPQFRRGLDSDGRSSLVGPSGLRHGTFGRNFTIGHGRVDVGSSVLSSASVDADGTVYVLTNNSDLIGVQDGRVVVRLELSKERLATCELHVPAGKKRYGAEITASPIVLAPGIVMVPSAHNLRMVMADCRDKSSPRIAWSNQEATGICNSATFAFNDTVLFASQGFHTVYAYDTRTLPFAANQNATWSTTLSDAHNLQAAVSVASDNGSIYVPVYHTPHSHLHVLYSNGVKAPIGWDLHGVPLTSPAIWVCEVGQTYEHHSTELQYVCDGKARSGFVYVGSSFGVEACDRAATQANAHPVWATNTSDSADTVQSSPAVTVLEDASTGNKYVYVYSAWSDSVVRALDGLRGQLIWTSEKLGNSGIVSSPAVDVNGTVYVASVSPPALYALDGRTGTELWKHPLDGEVVSSPSIVNEELIAISTTANMFYLVFVNGTSPGTTAPTTTPTTTPTTLPTTTPTTTPTTLPTTTPTTLPTTIPTTIPITTPTVPTTAPTTAPTSYPATSATTPAASSSGPSGGPPTTQSQPASQFGALTEWEFIALCIGGFIGLVAIVTIVYCNCIRDKSELQDYEQTPLRGDSTVRSRLPNTYESVNL